jgi:hypothetical protein
MAKRKKPPTSDPSDPGTTLFGLMWMRPAPGELAKGLARLKREREELEWTRITTRPKTAKPTSISIARKIARMRSITGHISPYTNGLAPETRDFVAALNAEAERNGIGVKFVATANRIEATGDIEDAASDPTTMIGWFLGRAIESGYLEGNEHVLRKGNSQHRKYLRKYAKTKAGMAEAAKAKAEEERQAAFLRNVAVAHGKFYKMLQDLPKAERDRLELDPEEHRVTRVPIKQRSYYRDKEAPEGDTGTQLRGEYKKPLR